VATHPPNRHSLGPNVGVGVLVDTPQVAILNGAFLGPLGSSDAVTGQKRGRVATHVATFRQVNDVRRRVRWLLAERSM
jgi:hypothetical protein